MLALKLLMPEETKWNIKEAICFYIYIQSILIICIFFAYGFVYSVKFICNPMLILMLSSYKFINILLRAVKNLSHPVNKFPTEVKQGKKILCVLSAIIQNNNLFYDLYIDTFLIFLHSFLVILLFKMDFKHSAEVLHSVSSLKRLLCAL